MAERRMFSKRIINSARFLKMPVSTQLLYFHLGLHADDDGVVEAYTVMNSVGVTEDDLRILVAKGFVQVLNDDLVTYITDWKENNKIRADRKVDSIYKELLLQMVPDAKLLQPRQRADSKKHMIEIPCGRPLDVQRTTNGQPMDCIGKERLGKDSIGKDSIDYPGSEDPEPPAPKPKKEKPVKHKYGEYKNVLLTDDELEKLKDRFPDWQDRIERLSLYIESKGAKYKSHYATILSWDRRENEQRNKTTGNGKYSAQTGYKKTGTAEELDEYYKMLAQWAEEGEKT